jgi:hypothetical protein
MPALAGQFPTTNAGYFEQELEPLAAWLRRGLGRNWRVRPAGWENAADAVEPLAPSVPLSRYGLVPMGAWTLLLSNGPLGTDVGLLPSQATREWACVAIRAACSEDDEAEYPARILAVYGPDGEPPLMSRRMVTAADDDGWVFEQFGDPFPFEQTDAYSRPRIRDRLTSEMLYEYLRQLGVPVDDEPAWRNAVVVEQRPRRSVIPTRWFPAASR